MPAPIAYLSSRSRETREDDATPLCGDDNFVSNEPNKKKNTDMSELELVIRRLPEHKSSIRAMHRSDPDFREVCEDLALATRALDHWRHEEERTRYYREVTIELEQEILKLLGPGRNERG